MKTKSLSPQEPPVQDIQNEKISNKEEVYNENVSVPDKSESESISLEDQVDDDSPLEMITKQIEPQQKTLHKKRKSARK